ncbi:hypothetical protein LA303_08905 [Candidatus Sulfidibacterium hydrothermale]|uniref:hypothetical protein n=1 Tax=Candidatus Sulfidibacterium hydrothermale TaxID=2875962 RepID=UPI001F0B6EB9|nr:hypothetical protein [Candidatus Sulfidibacterium hydrothermale]UBM61534.1 hypothetical protein LA303_08905 [Candidatus Sulfidibacterium hydrothermale]
MIKKKYLIIITVVLLVIITSLVYSFFNDETTDIWLPRKTTLEKDTSNWCKTSYLLTSYKFYAKISTDTLKNYPKFDKYWEDRNELLWKRYSNLKIEEKQAISNFLKYEKMDTIERNIQTKFVSGVYTINKKTNHNNNYYYDFMLLGILDTINNRFYLIKWYR